MCPSFMRCAYPCNYPTHRWCLTLAPIAPTGSLPLQPPPFLSNPRERVGGVGEGWLEEKKKSAIASYCFLLLLIASYCFFIIKARVGLG